jgi:hypothetical protein
MIIAGDDIVLLGGPATNTLQQPRFFFLVLL